MVAQAVNHAETATWMQDNELLRSYEQQMEQLQNASAIGDQAPQSVEHQADLEKLTQSIATLSLQLCRFEMQIQDRMHPISADLMANAALAQAMDQLPEPQAPPGIACTQDSQLLAPCLALPRMESLKTATQRISKQSNQNCL
jgi:hypothetical protein